MRAATLGYLLLLSTVLSVNGTAQAQTSIAAENIVDTVAFSYLDASGTMQEADVTIVRDERETEQWYYVPSKPILVTSTIGGKAVPEFTLLIYDYPDPTNSQTILRGGILNFSARLSLPPEALSAMMAAAKEAIAKRKGQGVADTIRIAALPINSARVSIYSNDKLVGMAEGTGTAPTFASQTMAFSLQLNQLGTAVFEELVESPAGVRTAVEFKYNGMTPRCGYEVKADYQQARDYYSKNEKFAARASYYGLFSGSASSEYTDIRDALEQSGALKIKVLASNDCPPERLDTLMQPILKRINDQVLETFRPPDAIDPAQAGTPSTDGFFGGAGYAVAVKQVSQLKKLSETISFEQATIVERTTVAQGFIGIGSYPESTRKDLVIVVDGTISPGTYLAFPQVPNGIDRVDLDVRLSAREEAFGTGQYQFLRQTNSWKNLQSGVVSDRISFSLAGIEQRFGKEALKDARLRATKTLAASQDNVQVFSNAPVAQGTAALDLQGELFGVRLSASALPFKQLGGDYVRAQVTAKAGDKSKTYVFQAINANGVWQAPTDEYFFVSQKDIPIELTIRFTRGDPNKSTTRQKVVTGDAMLSVFLDEIANEP